jgi:hypothetical protein
MLAAILTPRITCVEYNKAVDNIKESVIQELISPPEIHLTGHS